MRRSQAIDLSGISLGIWKEPGGGLEFRIPLSVAISRVAFVYGSIYASSLINSQVPGPPKDPARRVDLLPTHFFDARRLGREKGALLQIELGPQDDMVLRLPIGCIPLLMLEETEQRGLNNVPVVVNDLSGRQQEGSDQECPHGQAYWKIAAEADAEGLEITGDDLSLTQVKGDRKPSTTGTVVLP